MVQLPTATGTKEMEAEKRKTCFTTTFWIPERSLGPEPFYVGDVLDWANPSHPWNAVEAYWYLVDWGDKPVEGFQVDYLARSKAECSEHEASWKEKTPNSPWLLL